MREVKEFIEFAQCHVSSVENKGMIRCPCVNCLNERILEVVENREHLYLVDF